MMCPLLVVFAVLVFTAHLLQCWLSLPIRDTRQTPASVTDEAQSQKDCRSDDTEGSSQQSYALSSAHLQITMEASLDKEISGK